jgi:membrane protein implicated in regulation of membrane protease activity
MRIWIILGVVLIAIWVMMWLVFRILSWTIHILVVLGLILLLYGLVRRGARQARSRFGSGKRQA